MREERALRELEEDYNITQKLEEEAAKLPSRLGNAAGILTDIGFGIVNSLFALITILVLTAFMLGSGPPMAKILRCSSSPPTAASDWTGSSTACRTRSAAT